MVDQPSVPDVEEPQAPTSAEPVTTPETPEDMLAQNVDDASQPKTPPAPTEGEPGKPTPADSVEPTEQEPFIGTYSTKEAAEKGLQEKDHFIDLLKAKVEAYENVGANQPPPAPQQPVADPQAVQRYYEEIQGLIDEGRSAEAMIRVNRDMTNETKREEQTAADAKRVQYKSWSDDLKGKGIPQEEIDKRIERYETLQQQKDVNPLRYLGETTSPTPEASSLDAVNAHLKEKVNKESKRALGNVPPPVKAQPDDDKIAFENKFNEMVKRTGGKGVDAAMELLDQQIEWATAGEKERAAQANKPLT